MKTFRYLLLFTCLLITTIKAPCGAGRTAQVAIEVSSPDTAYKAVEKIVAGNRNLIIVEVKSNKSVFEISTFGVKKCIWAKDSKVLVVCEHLAGGSEAYTLKLSDGKWVQTTYPPPLKTLEGQARVRYGLIGLREVKGSWKLKYLVTRDFGIERDSSTTVVEFRIKPPIERVLDFQENGISGKKLRQIHFVGE